MADKGETVAEFLRLDDAVTHQIGHGHLGGGYQVEVLVPPFWRCQLEQVRLEFRQLPGALEGVAVDDVGDIDLGVAVLEGVHVHHELNQGAVQTRHARAHDREAGAGDSGRPIEVQAAQGLADGHMVTHLEAEVLRLAPAGQFEIAALV